MNGGELIRWEARSHEQIYHEVRCEETKPALTLAATVGMYKDFTAGLEEIRGRYRSLVRGLMGGSAGTGAEAAGVASDLVFRGLTDAYELTSLAGARRNKLSELNENLRRYMPEPSGAPEITSGFVGNGRSWLAPPDFEAKDSARYGAGEEARDLMRGYERSLTTLASSGGTELAAPDKLGVTDRHMNAPTVPLSTARHRLAVESANVPDQQVSAPPDGRRWVAAVQPSPPGPHPQGPGGFPAFGPRGHLGDEPATEGRPAGGAIGTPPPPRDDEVAQPLSPRREDHDLFPSDGKAAPPVIGL